MATFEQRFTEIRNQLHDLKKNISESTEVTTESIAATTKIKQALADLRSDLFESIRTLPFWQFRATLPQIRDNEPKLLVGLLEVCLLDETRRYWDLVDYIVTLLATEQQEGITRAVSRPKSRTTSCISMIHSDSIVSSG